jgi:hypothetical protein
MAGPRSNLPKILVPQDAYNFLGAMDEVIRQLPAEEPAKPGCQKRIDE